MRFVAGLFLAVVLLAGAGPAPVQAANWRFVASGPDGNSWVDTTTVQRQGDCVVFWHLMTFRRKPVRNRVLFSQLRIKTRICCRARTMEELEYVALDEELEEKSRWRPRSEARPVRPGTVAEALLNYVCKPGR
ncbi:MAG: hypothetical protein KKC37_10765 [Proteobacteria bacterium]|nr:hypothetical protein [Pseudomonadota bacterium]